MIKYLKEKDFRIQFILSVIVICISVFAIMHVKKIETKRYNDCINTAINTIVSNIKQKYPNVTEDEILNVLNNKKTVENSFLNKYGYIDEVVYLKQLQDVEYSYDIIICGVVLLTGILVVMLNIWYISKRNKQISEINTYIHNIANREYTLGIEENGETELSRLKNELYKITISLREVADINSKEKENLSDALADIAHQLRTPLTSIRIMLDNIEDDPNMDENTRRDFMSDISNQINWINNLINSLLKLAKFDSGTIKLNKENIDAKVLVEDIIKNLSILLEIKNIEIVSNIPDGSGFLGDYKWELEALTNIVKNAFEHSKDNSKIYVNVENNPLFLKVIIKDEGEGIEKEDLKHIFERFYKSKNASSNSIGIGLSLAKAIIEKDDGNITVNSEKDKGTIFEIRYIK